MKNSLETKLGIFVVLAVFAAWAIIETLGSADFFSHGYRVSAMFDSAQDLKAGDRVKMAGVEIGHVEKISLTENKVNVLMKLNADAAVKTDSKATIKFTGLMDKILWRSHSVRPARRARKMERCSKRRSSRT